MIGRWLSLLSAALILAGWSGGEATAQDLTSRKGFSVKITHPKADDLCFGEVTIRAEVTARHPEDVARVDFFIDDKLILSDTEPPFQTVFNFGKKSAARVIRVLATHRDGPTASDFLITKKFDLQYSVNVQRVVLDVSVRDSKRRVVQGLGIDDFSVTEESRPQRIVSVSPEKRPLLTGVLIDTSGSMRERIGEAQEAACRFLDGLSPEDRAFLIQFDDQVTLVEETTQDRQSLCRAVHTMEAIGETAIFDAIHAAFRVIHEPVAERRALVILSDGDDTSSKVTYAQILEEARLNDVTIYSIGLDVSSMSAAKSRLSELAEETGGRAFFVKKAADLAGVYEVIAEELRTLYQLVFASDNEKFDGRLMPIKVIVKKDQSLDVKHRAGYRAVAP